MKENELRKAIEKTISCKCHRDNNTCQRNSLLIELGMKGCKK